jgi:fido (protein-threonine AMPylation protein)
MKKEITINDFSKHLFWDVDLNGFELNKYQSFFIQRVLEYGNMKDWQLIKKLYGMEAIKNAALNARSLDAVTLSFVSTIFKIDKTQFRCYKHRQLFQNLWNS